MPQPLPRAAAARLLVIAVPAFVVTVLLTQTVATAQAQTAGAGIQYNIPPGSLAEALNNFAQQSGVAIVVDLDKVQGLSTEGLRGLYGIEEGFNALLQGSGYVIGKTAAGYVLLPAPEPARRRFCPGAQRR